MSAKFFNNIESTLMDKFHGIASAMANFDIFHAVVGYFRSSGYFKLRKELENVSEIRILVGINIDSILSLHNSNLLFTADSHTAEVVEQYRKHLIDDIRKSHYDADTEHGIMQMFDDIASGKLQLRIHATRNLHAKFYLCLPSNFSEHSDGWVIMGSSNLTDQGLGTVNDHRYELNVAMKDYDDVRYCEDEFWHLWEESVPVSIEDMQKARCSTHLDNEKPPTPYELYMKVLIDTFGNMVEDNFELDPTRYGFRDLSYQRDAVIQGYQTMIRHNGCFIADVVGLGKTPVATMIAKRFIMENGRYTRILVIMPPAMRHEWERTFKKFEISKYAWFVTSGSLDKVVDGRDNYRLPNEYDMIIVDEAHNFRNDGNTGYQYLQRICKAPRANRGRVEGLRKKVLLLSATPYNNTPMDIRNQLLLFQDARNCTIEGLGDITGSFSDWISKYKQLMRDRDTLPHDVFVKAVDKIMEEVRHRVLEPIMVRRTRNNILNYDPYRIDIEEQGIKFPKFASIRDRQYKMDDYLAHLFGRTMQILTDTPSEDNPKGTGVHYARYRAVEFFRPGVPYKGKQGKHVALLLTGIFRTHMVKRLESSFEAFKKSLHTFLNITTGMIDMFVADKVLIAPEYNVKQLQVEKEMDLDDIIQYIESKGVERKDFVYHSADFQPILLDMLREDETQLKALCDEWDAVDYDPKLELFVNMLQGELFNPRENKNHKLVIFSESVDTVNCLYRTMTERLGRTDVLRITAKNRDQERKRIAANFDANYSEKQLDEFNIIVTSDVLAEGVNLHRANVIVNYDSPWNASRLMQRNGRVNRIGSTSDLIYNYMFYPSQEGDKQIQLYSNALIKLQGFHSALGEDSQIYSHEEIVKEFELFNKNVHDENDDKLALIHEVSELHKDNPELYERIKNLPPKSRCLRSVSYCENNNDGSTLVFLASKERVDYVLVGSDDAPDCLSFMEAVKKLKAAPDEPGFPISDMEKRHFIQVNRAIELYNHMLQSQDTTVSMRINSHDKVVLGALKFLRTEAAATMSDEHGRGLCRRLQSLVEQGVYNSLPRQLGDLAKQQRSANPFSKEDLEQQIIDLAEIYCPDVEESTNNSGGNSVPDIIISETFIA
ncbi:MAG: helicase-related protein [Bacteroidales bacterium]|nr:helicase-related protein [Bacteroidales bacterium]